ncbi:unnamed protein product [Brachionus calyciflorus]|uniref:Uncharacterized protein n=1 Tax=Brachionus calyciflorus TaxID=104777 RepID=A0A814FZ75_9BILA|nr:unnamed protein product [Brachionus calyciflorus]
MYFVKFLVFHFIIGISLAQDEDSPIKSDFYSRCKSHYGKKANPTVLKFKNVTFINETIYNINYLLAFTNVEVIQIENCSLSNLVNASELNLKEYSITNSDLRKLNDSFLVPKTIRYLNFSFNKIRIIDGKFFRYFKNLKVVDLSRNSIFRINRILFNSFVLESLDFSFNPTRLIDRLYFGINKVRKNFTLNLNYLNLSRMPHIMGNLSHIPKINLGMQRSSRLFEGSVGNLFLRPFPYSRKMTIDLLLIDDTENLNSSYLTDSLICFINSENNHVKFLSLGRTTDQKEIGEPFKNFLESLNPINNITVFIKYFYRAYSKTFAGRLLFGDSFRSYYNKVDLHQNVFLINCRESGWGLFVRKRCEQSNRNFSLYNGTCSVDFSNQSDTTHTSLVFSKLTKKIETTLKSKMESDFSTSADSIQTKETQFFSTTTSTTTTTTTTVSSTTSSTKHLERETTTYSSLPKETTTVKQETSTLKKITHTSSSKKLEIKTSSTSTVTTKSTTQTTKTTKNAKIAEKMALSSSNHRIISSLLTSSLQLVVLIFVFNFK